MIFARSALRRHSSCAFCMADRKSTRLNSSHRCISYAVFCLKKKKHAGYRWLRKSPPVGSARNASIVEQRVEYAQQIQIAVSDIEHTDTAHLQLRVALYHRLRD